MRNTNDPEIQGCVEFVEKQLKAAPELAFILGSGLGSFANEVENPVIIPTETIPGYPVSTVPGHAGRLVAGTIEGVQVLVLQGRVHFYEGYPIHKVVYTVRLCAALGVKGLVVTNASGGVGDHLNPGDLMVIRDHVNLMGVNPLVGQNWGFDRFPDMTNAYHPELIKCLEATAESISVELKEGILGAWSGPTYETASEVRLLKQLGVTAACMSTVPEVITAARLKLPVAGISCITNKATGQSDQPLTHEEVTETAAKVEQQFKGLLRASVKPLAESSSRVAEKMWK